MEEIPRVRARARDRDMVGVRDGGCDCSELGDDQSASECSRSPRLLRILVAIARKRPANTTWSRAMTSVYHRADDGWKLVIRQQTPDSRLP
jgi:hypothetical protein